jgi:hypothetical protein
LPPFDVQVIIFLLLSKSHPLLVLLVAIPACQMVLSDLLMCAFGWTDAGLLHVLVHVQIPHFGANTLLRLAFNEFNDQKVCITGRQFGIRSLHYGTMN